MTYLNIIEKENGNKNENRNVIITYSKLNPTIIFSNDFSFDDGCYKYNFYENYYTINIFGNIRIYDYPLILNERCIYCYIDNNSNYLEKDNKLLCLNVSENINKCSINILESETKINMMINKEQMYNNCKY